MLGLAREAGEAGQALLEAIFVETERLLSTAESRQAEDTQR